MTSENYMQCLEETSDGHKVVVCDLSQIEARLTAWLTRSALLQTFIDDKDPYCEMASQIFGFKVTRANEIERFVGKAAVLGLGYGLGAKNFYTKTAAAARAQGLDLGDLWTEEFAGRTVRTYRKVNHATVKFWSLLDDLLDHEWRGTRAPARLGPLEIGHIAAEPLGPAGYVQGPGGLRMFYSLPEGEPPPNTQDRWYKYGKRWRKIYGAAMLENLIQFLARIIQTNAALRLASTGVPFLRMAHSVHDELVFVVPDVYVERAKQIILAEMTRRPSWAPDLPIKATIGSAQSYGGAKA